MSKKKQFEVWANKTLAKYQKIMLLDSYALRPITPSPTSASRCMFRYPYREIEVQYSQDLFEAWCNNKKSYATEVLIHELFHAVTDPLYAKATSRYIAQGDMEDEREQLTEHLTNILVRVLTK